MLQKNCIIFVILSGLIVSPLWAADKSGKPTLVEKVNHQSAFNSVTDWFATQGKTDFEKKKTVRQRKEARRLYRLRKIHQSKQAAAQRKEAKRRIK